MINFNGLTIKNLLLFREAELQLNFPGITVIQGNNKLSRLKENGNAVGKSLLLSAIQSTLFGALSGDRRKKAGSFEGASSSLYFTSNDVKWEVKRDKTIHLYRDDSNQEYHKALDAEKALYNLIPINIEQWSNMVYIQPLVSNIILYGTPAQRGQYIEKLSGLDTLENYRNLLNTRIQESSEAATEISVHKNSLSSLVLPIQSRNEIEKQIEKLENLLKNNQEKLSNFISLHSRGVAAASITTDKTSIEELQILLEIVKKDIEKISKKELAYRDFNIKRVEYNKYMLNVYKLQQVLKYNSPPIDIEVRNAKYQRYLKVKPKLEATLPHYKKLQAHKFLIGLDPIQLDLKIIETQETLDKFESLEGSTECPTCGHILEGEKLQEHIKSLRYIIDKDKRKKEKIIAINKLAKAFDDIKEWRGYKAKEEFDYVKKGLIQQNGYNDYIAAQTALRSIPNQQKPIFVSKPEINSEDKRHEQIKLMDRISKLESLEALKPFPSSDKLILLKSHINKLQDSYQRWQHNLDQLKMLLSEGTSSALRRKIHKSEIIRLTPIYKDLIPLKLLHKAYGPKGVVSAALEEYCEKFIQYVNEFAEAAFTEKYHFEYSVESRAINLTVTRNGLSSDIKRLSGYESRVFVIASVLALRAGMSPKRRTNLLIFDEIEAPLSDSNVKKFGEEILPIVNASVPSVVIATPRKILRPPDAKYLVVEKTKDKRGVYSHIIEG